MARKQTKAEKELADMMAEDAEADRKELSEASPNDKRLAAVRTLAQRIIAKEEEVSDLEEQLKEAKKALFELQTKELPDAMMAIGIEKFSLSNGFTVSVKDDLDISIPAEERDKAFTWLKTRGYGDLIKSAVSLSFKMGEEALRDKAKALLIKAKMAFEEKDFIHPGTLKSFGKEAKERKLKLPAKLFRTFYYSIASVSAPKVARQPK